MNHTRRTKRSMKTALSAVFALALLLTALTGCTRRNVAAETPEPAATGAPTAAPGPAEAPVPPASPVRENGERFEAVIILEGMEETVRYEHIRNDAVGIEMDYDYESFARQIGADRECFLSVYDDPRNPENYLEVTFSPESADAAAEAVRAELSREYDLLESTRELERAGACLRIEASVIKGTNQMADQLQAVYIIPAADGCRVARAHYAVEAAEGFGRRFSYLLDTLTVIERAGEAKLSDEKALTAVRNYCYAVDPDLERVVNAGEYPVYWEVSSGDETEAVILFRSYTGALARYYVNRKSGETCVTEFVPGVTAEEMRTEESFNAWDYVSGGADPSGQSASLAGTWQTASMAYESDGTMFPEWYVRFTDTEIVYGHVKGGEFVPDHTDQIIGLVRTPAGGYSIQAAGADGAQYTYRTGESDPDVLEYYETWREDDFPSAYRGGASLSRCG